MVPRGEIESGAFSAAQHPVLRGTQISERGIGAEILMRENMGDKAPKRVGLHCVAV